MPTIRCDVRPELMRGEEPFSTIMAAATSLGPDDQLDMFTTFEPFPLYRVLGARGFDHAAERLDNGVAHSLHPDRG